MVIVPRVRAFHGDLDGLLLGRTPLVAEPEVSRAVGVLLLLVDVALGANVVGDAPREGLVPAEDDAWDPDVPGPRDVHLRAGEMHLVPARDRAERDMRVARDHWRAARGLPTGDDPVVAAQSLVGVADHLADGDFAHPHRWVRTLWDDTLVLGLSGKEEVEEGTFAEHSLRQFGNRYDGQAAREIPAELLPDSHGVQRRPLVRLVAEQVELDWQVAAGLFHERVDAVRVCRQTPLRLLWEPCKVRLCRTAEADGVGYRVDLDAARPDDFGQATVRLASIVVKLPEAVLGRGVPVPEEQAVVGLREDVGHTPFVPNDVDPARHARCRPGTLRRWDAPGRLLRPPLVELRPCQTGILADRLLSSPRPRVGAACLCPICSSFYASRLVFDSCDTSARRCIGDLTLVSSRMAVTNSAATPMKAGP